MGIEPYRRVVRSPGVAALTVTMIFGRIPSSASGLVLTLHVALGRQQGGLGHGFAAAGLVTAAGAAGGAFGAPLVGRAIDRLGLRSTLAVTTAVSTLFWAVSPALSLHQLVPAVVMGGFFGIPVFSLLRQAMASMLPERDRQAGFSLDSMSSEISFSVGPVLGVVLVTQLGSTAALLVIAATMAITGLTLIVVDPPVRAADLAGGSPTAGASRIPVRAWLTGRVAAVLVVTAAGTLIFSGTDITIVAVMRSFDRVGLTGVVVAVWGLGSVVGGFVYGAAARRVAPGVLLLVVAVLTIPVALATSWPVLAALMISSALCSGPLITATADRLVRWTPSGVHGEVIGAHASALTVGAALGTPIAGVVIDATSPRWGFVGVGAVGLVVAVFLLGTVGRDSAAAAI